MCAKVAHTDNACAHSERCIAGVASEYYAVVASVGDSDTCVRYAEGKDGINNLMTIYSCFTGKTMVEIEREFEGRGYGDFKLAVGEACADALAPVQARYNELIADKAFLEAQMKKGADEASYYARKTLSKVKRKLGFVQI